MARHTYIWDRERQEMVPAAEYYARQGERQHVHGVIDDTMPATLNLSDGKYYDSKSAFRRVCKAKGLEEVGNDWKKDGVEGFVPKVESRSNREVLARLMRGDLPTVPVVDAVDVLKS